MRACGAPVHVRIVRVLSPCLSPPRLSTPRALGSSASSLRLSLRAASVPRHPSGPPPARGALCASSPPLGAVVVVVARRLVGDAEAADGLERVELAQHERATSPK